MSRKDRKQRLGGGALGHGFGPQVTLPAKRQRILREHSKGCRCTLNHINISF
ncbi:hypothetical protein N752_08330 [Desulforamulus aquiferis]|nr:hypothetical protein N752_08330 [Desulforamulus aquiferis]